MWERARQGPFRQPLVCVLCLSALGSEHRGVGAGSLPSPRHAHLCHCSGTLPAADQARESQSRQRQLGNPGPGGLVGPPPAASGFGVTLLVTKMRPSPRPESARHRGVLRPAAWLEKVTFLGQGVILGAELRPPGIQWLGKGPGQAGSPLPLPPGQQSCRRLIQRHRRAAPEPGAVIQ